MRWRVVTIVSLLYVVSFVDRLILALLVEPLKADLGISDTQIGLLIGTAFALLYAFLGVPIAWLVDRGNRTRIAARSEEHTSELQSLMRNSYAVFCLKKKKPHL